MSGRNKWPPPFKSARRRRWIAALRSGEYQQGKGRLVAPRLDGSLEYCCLGVACEVYAEETGKLVRTFAGGSGFYNWDDGTFADSAFLPNEVANWFGVKTQTGEFRTPLGLMSLTELNDLTGKTFKEIAQVIEDKPKGLLK